MIKKFKLEEDDEGEFEQLMDISGQWVTITKCRVEDYNKVKRIHYGSGNWNYYITEDKAGEHTLWRKQK